MTDTPKTIPPSTEAAAPPLDTKHIYRSLLHSAIPSVIGFAALHLYNIADIFWVSRLGPEPVAGVAIFAAFYWVISSVNQVAGAGSVAIISRRYGERDYERTQTAIVEAFVLKVITAVIFGAVGYLMTPMIVRLLGARDNVVTYAVAYGRVMFLGLVFNFPCFTLFTSLRSINHPRSAMAIMLGSTVFNAILNPFLIFGWGGLPRLGVAGAAWASLIGFGLTVMLGLIMFFAGAFRIRLDWASIRRSHFSTMWQMMKIGMPSGVGSISTALARMVVTPIIAHFGAPVIAVYGACSRVIEFGIVLVVGLELGLSPLVGHALGAKDKTLAWLLARRGVWYGIAMMTVFAAVLVLLAGPLTRMFFAGAPYHDLGVGFFRIMALSMPFLGAFLMYEGALSGAGNTVPPMVIAMLRAWVCEVPLVWSFSLLLGWGPNGAWWGFVVADVVAAVAFAWWFARGHWLHQDV
ncbi:MAG: MATE family efflux transporter [candidate division Zixibacteria bacterium]|nr:MATE family efflux transporter [candidate division Zixibacteria bacterium]